MAKRWAKAQTRASNGEKRKHINNQEDEKIEKKEIDFDRSSLQPATRSRK